MPPVSQNNVRARIVQGVKEVAQGAGEVFDANPTNDKQGVGHLASGVGKLASAAYELSMPKLDPLTVGRYTQTAGKLVGQWAKGVNEDLKEQQEKKEEEEAETKRKEFLGLNKKGEKSPVPEVIANRDGKKQEIPKHKLDASEKHHHSHDHAIVHHAKDNHDRLGDSHVADSYTSAAPSGSESLAMQDLVKNKVGALDLKQGTNLLASNALNLGRLSGLGGLGLDARRYIEQTKQEHEQRERDQKQRDRERFGSDKKLGPRHRPDSPFKSESKSNREKVRTLFA